VQKDPNIEAWLTLVRSPRLGGRKLIDLLEAAGGAAALVESAGADPGRFGLDGDTARALRQPDARLREQDLAWLEDPRRHLVAWDSDQYPALLRRIPSPPAALFVAGDPGVLWQPQLAMVGSRNPTAGGLDHARAFSAEMCRQGLTITSGLASGVDCAAHEAALDSGGSTVAVTGTGLDRVYPASSTATAGRIFKQGALVSEFPPGTPARRAHFPARNRIIAGLSLGVLVVEAGLNSGSLITARHAGEQGREVFALPGSLHNPLVKGCHRLIKQGARLVESSTEILQELGPLASELAMELRQALDAAEPSDGAGTVAVPQLPDDPDYQRLWGALGFDPKPVDTLVAQSGLGVRAVSSMLLMLELRGLVVSQAGSMYCRRR
jgi:DNA processing protein